MRIIKLAVISIIFLSLLITGISLLIPSHIRISKAINMKAEQDSVMHQISDPSRWKNWYPGLDTAKLLYVWGVVKGIVIDDKDPSHPAYIVMSSKKENEVTAQFIPKKMRPVILVWKTISYSNNDSVTLQWYMDFHLRWHPWEKFASLLLEKSYGTKMEQGLTNLKKIIETDRTSF
jgi:hypothetical protein